jgi:hypothetical protein
MNYAAPRHDEFFIPIGGADFQAAPAFTNEPERNSYIRTAGLRILILEHSTPVQLRITRSGKTTRSRLVAPEITWRIHQ